MHDNVQLGDRRPVGAPHHRPCGRPPFERIALLLQGGGALGAYQGGVYEGLAEAGLHPDWTAGISIGAINAALIAGNPPEQRVEKLRQFWELVAHSAATSIPGVNLRRRRLFDDSKGSIPHLASDPAVRQVPQYIN